MSMTNASMNAQTRSLEGATEDTAALTPAATDVPVVIQANPETVVATVKTSDPNWSHCNIKNDY